MNSSHRRFSRPIQPLAMLLVASVGLVGAFAFVPGFSAQRHPPGFAPETNRLSKEIRPAVYSVYVQESESTDLETAWAQMIATIELVSAADRMVAEAESLRSTAEAFAQKARSEQSGRLQARDDTARRELPDDESRRALAEGELAIADKVLEAARIYAERAHAAFDAARENLLRSVPADPPRDPSARWV